MADSLDEFFAKKDKSKKTKKKNLSCDEMAKKLEETGRKADKQRKDKEKMSSTSGSLNTNILEQEDDEWNDFEEEREKDYSGLRIQTLSIKDKEEELREQQMQENGDESKKDKESGPWKISAAVSEAADAEDQEKAAEEEEVVTPSAQTPAKKYVPPHMRNQPASTLTPITLSGTRKAKVAAPQIGDTTEFPSLGATNNDSSNDLKGFQTVKYGSREIINRNAATSQVTLDNKYGALSSGNKEEYQNSAQ